MIPTGANSEISNVLIIEPDLLTRWSLVTYLKKWFGVHAADSRESAQFVLREVRLDGLVLSAELPPADVDAIERQAIETNPQVRVVRTIVHPAQQAQSAGGTRFLEKPFKLSELASLLGVEVHDEDSTRTAGG